MAFISGYLFDFCNYFDETDAPIHSFIINFKSLESLGCPWCNIARNAARQLHRVVGWNCCAQCRLQCCKSRSEFSFGNHACSELKSVDQWPFSQLWARVAKWRDGACDVAACRHRWESIACNVACAIYSTVSRNTGGFNTYWPNICNMLRPFGQCVTHEFHQDQASYHASCIGFREIVFQALSTPVYTGIFE